ncbi:TPA: hypothetical protein ROX98_000525 [Bacillus pseudomycoides]|nr:hypothetical protein [Bacillus pseudomycoides]
MMEKKSYLPEDAYCEEDIAFVKELVEVYGIPEGAAIDCFSSRTVEEMKVVLTFLRRYGHMIKTSFVQIEKKVAPKDVFVVLKVNVTGPPEIWRVYENESDAKAYIEENQWSKFVYEKQKLFK